MFALVYDFICQLNKYAGQKGIRHFAWVLFTMFGLAILLFIFFVITTANCEGLLYGIDEALIFLIGFLFYADRFSIDNDYGECSIIKT